MASERPQYFENKLQPVTIDKPTLLKVLDELQAAVKRGVDLIEANCPPPQPADEKAFGTIFNGNLGIALAFLRLEHQVNYLRSEDPSPFPDFRTLAKARVNPHVLKLDLQPGRPSPLASASLGAALVRIVAESTILPSNTGHEAGRVDKNDYSAFREAVRLAIDQEYVVPYRGHTMGGDEVLYGRAGLLWAVLNLRNCPIDKETRDFLCEAVPKLVDAIIDAGKVGAQEYVKLDGEPEAFLLMWTWLDEYYALGAIHGITGILAILLTCRFSELEDHFSLMAHTITAVCKLCISFNGHLPMSVPSRLSSRHSPLVQVCHGTPGLLVLLARARSHEYIRLNFWRPEWDEAIRLGSERVWEEGLLSKGGGLCHGIAGNAWPWLLLHESFGFSNDSPDEGSGDLYLSRALAFLLHARETQPFNVQTSPLPTEVQYRMPDAPYSLFEGLAGTVCAWADACVLILARLRRIDSASSFSGTLEIEDEVLQEHLRKVLGMPGLGGRGFGGFL